MRKRYGLLLLVLMSTGCGAMDALDPQNHLEQWVENEKKSLPRKVDKYVQCVDIEAGEMEVIFIYTANDLTDQQATSRKQLFMDRAIDHIRKHPKTYQRAVDYKIPLTHVYRNGLGRELFRFTVRPWEL